MEEGTIDIYRIAVERFFDRATKIWKVQRVRFETNKGEIVYRPSKKRGVYREISGKKVCFEQKEMITLPELPQVIIDASHEAIEQGICKVKAKCKALKREGRTYQYFAQEDVESMEIVPVREKV